MSQSIHFKKISIQNFKSIGPKIIFDFEAHNGLNFVHGINDDIPGSKNGVGKTCIYVDAPCFALFGKTVNNINNEFVGNRFYNSQNIPTEVALNFEVDDQEYITSASIKQVGYCVNFKLFKKVDGKFENISKSTTIKTREFLNKEILKCDFDLFRNSIILSTSGKTNFFEMGKQLKRNYLENIFRLTCFGKMSLNMKVDLNNVNKEILILQKELNVLKNTLNDYDKESKLHDAKITVKLTELKIKLENKQTKSTELKIELSDEEKEDLKKLEKLEEFKNVMNKIDSSIMLLNNKIKNNHKDILSYNKQLSKHQDIIKLICKDCQSKVEQKFNFNEIEQKLKELEESTNQHKENIEKLNIGKKTISDKLKSLTELKIKLDEIINNLNKNKYTKEHLSNDIQELNKQLSEYEKNDNPFLKLMEKTSLKISESESLLSSFYKKKELLEIMIYVVGEEGVKKYIIKELVDILNNLILKYLEELGSNYTVIFDETFDAKFLTNSGETSFHNFSGCEQSRLNIAALFAFKDILSSNGITSSICVIDEILDEKIDEFALKGILNILKRHIVEKNQTIFLISHRSEILEMIDFDNIIELKKKNGLTRILYDAQGELTNEDKNEFTNEIHDSEEK